MDQHTISTMGSDDNLMEDSTAPTTPDGSLTFSPALRALRIQDAFEDVAFGDNKETQNNASIRDALQLTRNGVQNICCIGAGYVGVYLAHFVLVLLEIEN